jgi:hypothetical protein
MRRISRLLIHLIGHDVPPRLGSLSDERNYRTDGAFGADEIRTQPASIPWVSQSLGVGLVRSMDLEATWFRGKKDLII